MFHYNAAVCMRREKSDQKKNLGLQCHSKESRIYLLENGGVTKGAMRRGDCDQRYAEENYPNSNAQDKVTVARNKGRETKMHGTAEVHGRVRGVQNMQ